MPTEQSLIDAVKAGDRALAREILARDPHAAAERPAGQPSAALMAAYTGDAELLALLVERLELDVFEAAATGDVARVEALVARDPGLLAAHSGDGWTPLHLAAFFARHAVAERLLDLGADPRAVSANGLANTPLHAGLAGRTDPAVAELLVRRGADPNHRAAGGYTPLHLAASRGALPVIELLLAAGADPSVLTDDGKTAALIAAERGHPAAAERLALS